MKKFLHRAALILAAFILPLLRAATPVTTEYKGFTIDETQLQSSPDLAALRAATHDQIDIVCAVGLPPEMLKFFQTVPFELVPATSIRTPTPAVYEKRRVRLSPNIVAVSHRPLLLHEFMHAYHQQKLPQSNRNPDILGFYEKAKSLNTYSPKSHMMENQNEFFACSATTYLFSVTAQEPFKREKVKTAQPGLHAFLEKLFGPAAGSYLGSLTTSPASPPAASITP